MWPINVKYSFFVNVIMKFSVLLSVISIHELMVDCQLNLWCHTEDFGEERTQNPLVEVSESVSKEKLDRASLVCMSDINQRNYL